ncbi:hypothetical protein ALI144C_20585 [Actinosynnema sp. ALI-1.44]|uniref:asparagine synthase-related protein n=1 Tax=Actinosynnema sp. ALI-1.44 TaxID=1933779 RepID=UPI00097C3251|nr:asparagine synthase-related protein [Actinosynnema sp. ALI-1.44]ONI80971.1 hypothetical protein ALI144C_20585 [Actinosynnema sp. ALI-1.44]
MTGFPAAGQTWFVALPDCTAALPVLSALAGHASCVLRHASGRPWLVGTWADDQAAFADSGDGTVAVLGPCPVDPSGYLPAPVRNVRGLDRLTSAMPGSVHLVASIAGQVRVQGTVSGLRRVFHARIGDVRVAANRADVLAALTESVVDERVLALRLLGMVPYPLADMSPWHGITAVPPDSFLQLDGDGRARSVRWWYPPDPVLSLAEGAQGLRAALRTAVDVRTRAGGTVSCDLSGGLDSTPLCYLAARGPARLVTFTTGSRNPGDDDMSWAGHAAAGLHEVQRDVLDPADLPPPYQDILTAEVPMDEPMGMATEITRAVQVGRRLVTHGQRVHLTGLGGDEVLVNWEQYLNDLVRRHPLRALAHVRGNRAVFRWPLAATLRMLFDRRSYREWLADEANLLTTPPPPGRDPLDGWGHPLRLPPWATRDAVDAVRELVRDAAQGAEPLAPTRGGHTALLALRRSAYDFRLGEQVMARLGLRVASPYLDDRVVDACLAVRPEERTTPWRHKPLIVEAMRGLVPDSVFNRTTKAETSADTYVGLRWHRGDLLELWEDPYLARLGLVDARALRALCQRPAAQVGEAQGVWQATACEMWLRGVGVRQRIRG